MSVLPSLLKSPLSHTRWLGSEIQLQGCKSSASCCEMLLFCELAVRCCRDEADEALCACALDVCQARELPAKRASRVSVSRTRVMVRRAEWEPGCRKLCQGKWASVSVSRKDVMNPFMVYNLSWLMGGTALPLLCVVPRISIV